MRTKCKMYHDVPLLDSSKCHKFTLQGRVGITANIAWGKNGRGLKNILEAWIFCEKLKDEKICSGLFLLITEVLPKHIIGENRHKVCPGHTHRKSDVGSDRLLPCNVVYLWIWNLTSFGMANFPLLRKVFGNLFISVKQFSIWNIILGLIMVSCWTCLLVWQVKINFPHRSGKLLPDRSKKSISECQQKIGGKKEKRRKRKTELDGPIW